MKRLIRLILLTILAALLLVSCSSAPSLDNTQWRLTRLAGVPVTSLSSVTLKLDSGELSGSDGCNTYGGSYASRGSSFKVGTDIFSTLMACEEPLMTQASMFYTALNRVETFNLEGSKLTLMDAGGSAVLEFESMGK